MDIEGMEEEQSGLPGLSGGKEGLQPPRNRSPPSSVRSKKSSSFFFSALSKSPSSSSLVGQKMSPSTVSAAESLRAASSRRPSSIKALPPPNLVLPSFDDVFNHAPRSTPAPSSSRKGLAKKTLTALGTMLGGEKEARGITPSEEKLALGRERGRVLPKTLSLVTGQQRRKGIRKVVILGVHGWFPTGLTRRVRFLASPSQSAFSNSCTLLSRQISGEPTGTSIVFANKMRAALERYLGDAPIEALESLTVIPLEGDGTVRFRVDKLFGELTGNNGWVKDLREADAIFVGTHSQGCPVSTHLLAKLFDEGYIRSPHNTSAVYQLDDILKSTSLVDREYPRVAFLGLCGVHSGPLTTLSQSSVVMPYIQYFENAAAHELFDFQDTESETSKSYIASLTTVLDHGCKMVFVASLNDQFVLFNPLLCVTDLTTFCIFPPLQSCPRLQCDLLGRSPPQHPASPPHRRCSLRRVGFCHQSPRILPPASQRRFGRRRPRLPPVRVGRAWFDGCGSFDGVRGGCELLVSLSTHPTSARHHADHPCCISQTCRALPFRDRRQSCPKGQPPCG